MTSYLANVGAAFANRQRAIARSGSNHIKIGMVLIGGLATTKQD